MLVAGHWLADKQGLGGAITSALSMVAASAAGEAVSPKSASPLAANSAAAASAGASADALAGGAGTAGVAHAAAATATPKGHAHRNLAQDSRSSATQKPVGGYWQAAARGVVWRTGVQSTTALRRFL